MNEAARAFWSLDELARVAGGRWLGDGARGHGQRTVAGVSIDSRTIQSGQVFVAIRGERFDGHDFVGAAVERGAGMVIVDDAAHAEVVEAGARVPVLVVDDARRALGMLASAYRDRLHALVIGVTGSNGKTSTVRMIDAMFRGAGWRVASAVKSFNNDIGVPLTVLNAAADVEVLVCEIGMNNAGEIAALGAIVRPHAAVVTSIGRAHVGRLGSVGAIAREKLSLLGFVKGWEGGRVEHRSETGATKTGATKTGAARMGLALVPALGAEPAVVDLALDDLHEDGVLEGLDLRRVRAGDGHGVRWRLVEADDSGVSFTVEDDAAPDADERALQVFRVPMLGTVMAGNAALAVTVGRWAGLEDAVIALGLKGASGAEGRMSVASHRRDDGTMLRVLDDCYNASPESMLAALIESDRQAAGLGATKVLVLGSMGEMGGFAECVHREIGRALVERGLVRSGDVVLGVGESARWMVDEARGVAGVRCLFVESVGSTLDAAVDEGVEWSSRRGSGSVLVLVKGSRSVGLEGVAGRLLRS